METRIAFVTPGSYPIPSPTSTSVEQAVYELANKLQLSAQVDVYGCLAKGFARRKRYGRVTYIRVPGRPGQYAAQVVKRLKRKQYRVIQVENRPRLAAYVKRRLPHTAVWLSLHSLTFISTKRSGARRLARWLAMADRIVVNSLYLKEEVSRLFPELEPKLLVNHLGVNIEQFTSRWTDEGVALRENVMKRLMLADRKIILYVGRLIPLKGVHHLLAAMPTIVERVPEALLLIVGGAQYGSKRETAYIRSLKKLAERIPGHVRFVSYVPHNRVQDWYRLADTIVVPTPSREAFGLVNVEAMAAGIPVVGCAAGGIPEVVEHGRTGFLIPPERLESELPDYIGRILTDPDLQVSLGLSAMERVQQAFIWERSAERWLALLEEHTMR